MGNNLQESLENTINTMGTLLGVHPIVPWYLELPPGKLYKQTWQWNISIFNGNYTTNGPYSIAILSVQSLQSFIGGVTLR